MHIVLYITSDNNGISVCVLFPAFALTVVHFLAEIAIWVSTFVDWLRILFNICWVLPVDVIVMQHIPLF